MFRDPQGDECFTRATRHDGGDTGVFLERGQNFFQRSGLVRLRSFPGSLINRICQPRFDGFEIVSFEPIQIRAAYAEESLPLIQHRWKFVAVCEQNSAVNVRAVGQTHER